MNSKVFVSDFEHAPPRKSEVKKRFTYTTSRQYALPLPVLTSPDLAEQSQVSLLVPPGKVKASQAIKKWVFRSAAFVRILGDKILAQEMVHNGMKIHEAFCRIDAAIESPAAANAALLQVIYDLAVPEAQVFVTTINRMAETKAGFPNAPSDNPETKSNVTVTRVLIQLLPKNRKVYLELHDRNAIFAIGDFGKERVRTIQKVSDNELILETVGSICIKVLRKETKISTYILKGQWLEIEVELLLFGKLTPLILATQGTNAHTPWYAELLDKRHTLHTPSYLAAEIVSPLRPTSLQRANSIAGGRWRLNPSGATLFDYHDASVQRFVTNLLEINGYEGGTWLAKQISEAAFYTPSKDRREKAARLVSRNIGVRFVRVLEAGNGLPNFEHKQAELNTDSLLNDLFKAYALCLLWRKHLHTESARSPKRKYVLALQAVLHDSPASPIVFVSWAHRLLSSSSAKYGKYDKQLENYISITRSFCEEYARNEAHVGIRNYHGLSFAQLDSNSWYLLKMVEKSLGSLLRYCVILIWNLSQTLLRASLPLLTLLVGAEDLLPLAQNVSKRRLRKYYVHRVAMAGMRIS